MGIRMIFKIEKIPFLTYIKGILSSDHALRNGTHPLIISYLYKYSLIVGIILILIIILKD